jgi:hypothetical protein
MSSVGCDVSSDPPPPVGAIRAIYFAETEPDVRPAEPLSRVEIDTDGACKRNPDGPGGWGVIWSSGRHRRELHGDRPVLPTTGWN